MSSIDRLYVQTLDRELPPQDRGTVLRDKVARLGEKIEAADAVVLGLGSGVSTAAGYDFYHQSAAFDEAFGDFERAHGFHTLFDGLYHVFGSNEEAWALNAAVTSYVARLPVGQVYEDLAQVLRNKDHFVITTNVDGQAPRSFSPERVWKFQGDLRYVQCSQPCNDDVTDFVARADELVARTELVDGVPRVPYDLLPRCDECHHLMVPWVRDEHFCEGDAWTTAREAYSGFLRRHLLEGEGRVLFLEMGVSSMTPAIIKLPFWDMVRRNPNASYVDVNVGDATSPEQLGDRALTITADAAVVADMLR